MNTENNHHQPTLPELPPMPPGKPAFTKNARSMGIMLIICAIVTAAAIITVCFRHFRFDFSTDGAFQSLLSLLPLLSFYLIPIIGPIFILSLSLYLKRSASPVDAVLLIFPIGCAIGCLYMAPPPTITMEKSWAWGF